MSQLMTYGEEISRLNFGSTTLSMVCLGRNKSQAEESTGRREHHFIETKLLRLGKESPDLKVRTSTFYETKLACITFKNSCINRVFSIYSDLISW